MTSHWRRLFGVLALLGVMAITVPAMAAERTSAQCGREFDQCERQCNRDFKDDVAQRAPCVAKCSGLYAACDAGVAYEKAKPWLEDQARKTRKFFDELLEKYGGEKQPDPQTEKKKNSI